METYFEPIYSIKIHEPTLRELLVLQSFFFCKTEGDITKLVKSQPNPLLFYKTFLELGVSNLMTILAFDSQSTEHLLHEKNEKYFDRQFPIIYTTKIYKQQTF